MIAVKINNNNAKELALKISEVSEGKPMPEIYLALAMVLNAFEQAYNIEPFIFDGIIKDLRARRVTGNN